MADLLAVNESMDLARYSYVGFANSNEYFYFDDLLRTTPDKTVSRYLACL